MYYVIYILMVTPLPGRRNERLQYRDGRLQSHNAQRLHREEETADSSASMLMVKVVFDRRCGNRGDDQLSNRVKVG